MSRLPGTPDAQLVRPSSNVYTALSAAAALITLLALIYLFMRASDLFGGKGLL